MIHAVIMAGGSGTRFWPRSRKAMPKQLLPLAGDQSLLAETVARLDPIVPPERILIITNIEHVARIRKACPRLMPENVIGEPVGRDTAPCIGLAARLLAACDPEAMMLVLPADHVIRPAERFRATCVRAAEVALRDEALVAFGIRPTFPATGYGYIRIGERIGDGDPPLHRVLSFREKPDRATAEQLLAAGDHDWNGGIFCFRAAVILGEIERLRPDLAQGLGRISTEPELIAPTLERVFPTIPKVSIDHAVMERSDRLRVLRTDFEWDDVGSWAAVERHRPKDADGNCVVGDFLGVDARRNTVFTEGGFVAAVGVEDLIIVRTGDAILVCRKDRAEDVKQVVDRLGDIGRRDLM